MAMSARRILFPTLVVWTKGQVILSCLFLCSLSAQTSAQDQRERPEEAIAETPESLLQRSYLLGNNFGAEERCSHLYTLARAATQIHSPQSNTLVKNWSNELYR